ncbi:hypothetical protein CRYUN_Cryun02cG0194800 [Craigia yunnanensis]
MEKEESNGCSSIAYKLFFSCPFGLSPPQIWDLRVQKYASLFNGKKFRYGGYSQKSGDGSNQESYVWLLLGLTDYRSPFYSICLCMHFRNLFILHCSKYTIFLNVMTCQHTSSPLGNGAIVETSDKKIVVLQRSNNVGEFPGHFVFPGGHPEIELEQMT